MTQGIDCTDLCIELLRSVCDLYKAKARERQEQFGDSDLENWKKLYEIRMVLVEALLRNGNERDQREALEIHQSARYLCLAKQTYVGLNHARIKNSFDPFLGVQEMIREARETGSVAVVLFYSKYFDTYTVWVIDPRLIRRSVRNDNDHTDDDDGFYCYYQPKLSRVQKSILHLGIHEFETNPPSTSKITSARLRDWVEISCDLLSTKQERKQKKESEAKEKEKEREIERRLLALQAKQAEADGNHDKEEYEEEEEVEEDDQGDEPNELNEPLDLVDFGAGGIRVASQSKVRPY